MGAALAVGEQVGGGDGARSSTPHAEAFVYAMTRASLVTAAFAVVGALLAWRLLPARAAEAHDLDESEPAGPDPAEPTPELVEVS